MFALRDTFLIAGAECRKTLKSVRAVVLLGLFGLFSTLVLLVFHSVSRRAAEKISEQLAATNAPADAAARLANEVRAPIVSGLFALSPEQQGFLASLPLELLFLLKATWMFLPLYVAIMGFDQLSAEIGPRSIRYLVVRTPRSSVLLGKWLAQVGILFCLILVVFALSLSLIAGMNEGLGVAVAARAFVQLSAVTLVFALTYTALASLCSAVVRTPALSLTLNLIALFVLWLLATVGGLASEGSAFSFLKFLSPWHFTNGLVNPDPSILVASLGAHLGFAALFLGGAWLLLKEHDL